MKYLHIILVFFLSILLFGCLEDLTGGGGGGDDSPKLAQGAPSVAGIGERPVEVQTVSWPIFTTLVKDAAGNTFLLQVDASSARFEVQFSSCSRHFAQWTASGFSYDQGALKRGGGLPDRLVPGDFVAVNLPGSYDPETFVATASYVFVDHPVCLGLQDETDSFVVRPTPTPTVP